MVRTQVVFSPTEWHEIDMHSGNMKQCKCEKFLCTTVPFCCEFSRFKGINLLKSKVTSRIRGVKLLSYSTVLYKLHTDNQLYKTVCSFSKDSIRNTPMRPNEALPK